MAPAIRHQLDNIASKKEDEIEIVSQQLNTTFISTKYTDISEKNITSIKQTADDWVKGIRAVEKELIDQEQQKSEYRIKRDELKIKNTEDWNNQCMKKLNDAKTILRTCSDAALLQQEVEISRQLTAIITPSQSKSNQQIPTISLQQPTPDVIKAILWPSVAIYFPPKCLENLQETSRFRLPDKVLDISSVKESKAWVAIENKTMLVTTNGEILVNTESCQYGVVAALSNGDALYTPSYNVISRIDQTGNVSLFTLTKSTVLAILTMNEDVFVATSEKIRKLDNNGKKIKSLRFKAFALTSMPNNEVAAIGEGEKLIVIRARDCKVLKKDIDVAISAGAGAFTADRHGRLIRGHTNGKMIYLFQDVDGEYTRIKDYNVGIHKYGIYAVDIDDSNNLWIGTSDGEVIVTKYCQSE